MADDSKDQEKTEEPTGKKLEQAKEEGNVSKSAEVNSVILLTLATIVLYASGGWMWTTANEMFEEFYKMAIDPVNNIDNASVYWSATLYYTVILSSPVILMLVIGSVLTNIIQTGVVFSTKVLEFKPERLSLAKGFGKIFSTRGLVELVKGISKIGIVTTIIWFTVRGDLEAMISLPVMPLQHILIRAGEWVVLVTARILSALLILSIFDAIYQRYKYRKDLRMTKQEVKDEYKQMEGDPQVKGARKRFAIKLSRTRRIDHAVLNSDVVITNPTHYAVAIRYKTDEMDAPVVMVKGMRNRALKIREYAKHYDVPILENPPVARALYAAAEEGQAIPPEMYQVVAEILAYVYKMNQQKAA
ncbi:flagellar biosynthesis protein FlhB [bacterium]|nr:MAG: flagellar biosynthesis protein FlhB [bacterium]